MAATTVTGKQIRQGLIDRDWLFIGAAVGAGSTTSKIADATLNAGAALASTRFDGGRLRVTSGTYAGAETYVDYVDTANGFVYVDPALPGALADTDEYEIWLRGIDPNDADRARDDALDRVCSVWRLNPISIVADGDMDSSGVTHWAIAGAATRTKQFSSHPEANWRRELAVVHTTAASDYVKSDSIICRPGERFFVQVPVRAYVTSSHAKATASIEVRDITNTADVSLGGLKTSGYGYGWDFISLLFTIPAGCYEIQLWLKSDTDASTTVWAPINIHKRQKTRLSLPDRIRTKKRVGTFYTAANINPADSEVADWAPKLKPFLNVERVQQGVQVQVNLTPPTMELPIYYYERGFFDRLSTDYKTTAHRSAGDAATTDCPLEYAIAGTAERLSKKMLEKGFAEWQPEWVRASADLSRWEMEFGPEPQLISESESVPFIPNLRV